MGGKEGVGIKSEGRERVVGGHQKTNGEGEEGWVGWGGVAAMSFGGMQDASWFLEIDERMLWELCPLCQQLQGPKVLHANRTTSIAPPEPP